MDKIIEKLGEYNIFTNLLPDILFIIFNSF